MASFSLHNRTRPRNYKSWLADTDQAISSSTLRSRERAERLKQQSQEEIVADEVGSVSEESSSPSLDEQCEMDQSSTQASDGGPMPQLLPDGDEVLYPGSDVKKNDLLLLVLSFVLRFRLSATACQSLIMLFNTILPGCIPASNYLVNRFFGLDCRNVVVHYFCANSDCMEYFGPNVPEKCVTCNTVYSRNSSLCKNSFMFVLPLVDQLKCILQNSQILNMIFSGKQQLSSNGRCDVFSGKMYTKSKQNSNITLQFNCDGAPVFNSSKFSMWPLVCAINELPAAIRNCNLMLHTLWFGRIKPCAATFLQPFVSEITSLYNDGLQIIDNVSGATYTVFVNATLCICDAPARAMLQELTQFNGQYGCGFCYHPGERTEKGAGTVQVYPMNDVCHKRNHSETLKYAEQATSLGKPVMGVKGPTVLSLLPNFDIITCFVPEYMHCVLLGVVRQFVNLWLDSSSHYQPYYIKNFSLLDKLLKSVRPPDEIRRLPRTFADRKYWKATEFGNFLLIYSPVVLLGILPRRFYMHWLLLCNGVRLLLQANVTDAMISTSRNCLNKFITLIPELYDTIHVSYNVHLLCHLPDAVRNWGPLWSHSAFVYEDALGFVKKTYHGTQLVPKQVFKYFSAWNKVNSFSRLLTGSADSVLCLYQKLLNSNRYISSVCRGTNFVGLLKSNVTYNPTDEQSANVRNLFCLDSSDALKFQSYDRFLIKNKVFCTVSYSNKLKRNNSFVLLSNGCFADINCCVTVRTCACDYVDCKCYKYIALFVSCYLSTPIASRYDSYVGIDLTKFVRKVRLEEHQMIAVTVNDVVTKCITISNNDIIYALQMPEYDLE